ncbi:EVE domain-containing protein [Sulfidibacter corallicola]|uniref:EVE domain-containing protein n=1 Tax=Sulfidibacter corallicola TaxID=2818388 RepID=A0A8A4TF11_SULCO|nr:EVE domain-containing protein [Sulfidibacter corallicola]QTD48127.1 EVE domain-containing protein [Sulfidibacter corallicola]
MNYWLLKTEPEVFSLDDLKAAGREHWDGVRNYQARNFIRDEMKVGDGVLIYHSRTQPIGIVGEARVASEPYPDPTQFNADEKYYDPKSPADNPRWFVVDIEYVDHFPKVLPLADLKQTPGLEKMVLTQKGSRLSVQPVRPDEWTIVQRLAGRADKA